MQGAAEQHSAAVISGRTRTVMGSGEEVRRCRSEGAGRKVQVRDAERAANIAAALSAYVSACCATQPRWALGSYTHVKVEKPHIGAQSAEKAGEIAQPAVRPGVDS